MIFRIGGCVLSAPVKTVSTIQKGVLILTYPDIVCKEIPGLRRYFVVVERRGWSGVNDASCADIKLVEDWSTALETQQLFPQAILLNAAGADFVDTDIFRPLGTRQEFMAIFIGNWSQFKRHDLFIDAAESLSARLFALIGYCANGGTMDELRQRDRVVERCHGTNVILPFERPQIDPAECFKPAVVNRLINLAYMGVIASRDEGRNRFKTECMAADLPVLVPGDSSYPIRQLITAESGVIYEPSPKGLAIAMEQVLKEKERFSPRKYLLSVTGIDRSMTSLTSALCQLEEESDMLINKELSRWNGRFEEFVWGRDLLRTVSDLIDVAA